MVTKKRTNKMTVKKTAKKTAKKTDKKFNNNGVTRTFVNGKMIVTLKNGRTKEITKEELQTRLANVANVIANRNIQRWKMLYRIIQRIEKEQNTEKKAKMERNKARILEMNKKLPKQKDIENRLQRLIDAIDASI